MNIVCIEPVGITKDELLFYSPKLQELGHTLKVYDSKSTDINELKSRIKEAEILILSNQSIPLEVYKEAKNLKLIDVAFTGVDHIPVDYCKQQGINVCNAAGYSTNAVAELNFGMILEIYRNMHAHQESVVNSEDRKGHLGFELNEKTFGIIGMGAIGLKVAEIAKAFGSKVIAYSRSKKEIEGVDFVSLEELLKESDIVSLHTPLTEETKHLISEKELKMMKNSAILINTARGPIIDFKALKTALINNDIAAAATDVFEYEPPLKEDHILMDAPNCFMLPHIGYATNEAIQKRTVIIMENIFSWLNKHPQNLIV